MPSISYNDLHIWVGGRVGARGLPVLRLKSAGVVASQSHRKGEVRCALAWLRLSS